MHAVLLKTKTPEHQFMRDLTRLGPKARRICIGNGRGRATNAIIILLVLVSIFSITIRDGRGSATNATSAPPVLVFVLMLD